MNVTQTLEIPVSRRLTIDVPREIPAVSERFQARDIELINRNAERLNREALDVLSFQSLDI